MRPWTEICAAGLRGSRQQLCHRRRIRRSGRREKPVHKLLIRRCHRQAADVNHAASTDDEAMRVGKPDVATDASVLDGVEHAIDVGTLVTNDINQVDGRRRHIHVDGISGADAESAERIERVAAGLCCRRNAIRAAGIADRRLCTPVRTDDRLRQGKGRTRHAEQGHYRQRHAAPLRECGLRVADQRPTGFDCRQRIFSDDHQTLTRLVPDDTVDLVHFSPRSSQRI